MREFLTGNEALVRGALRAGCDFFAGYPITPASSVLSDMIAAFSDGSGIAVQTEDEIAAIGQCIGASIGGARAMTATSGPGLSLYSENIGLAQMGEVPLVIVDCQRMGPATGGATASGEGDVIFARHATAGSYPLPVLAATDASSSYRLCYEAFNIAERFRTPVVLLLSKEISLTRQTADLAAIPLPPLVKRRSALAEEPYRPYAFAESSDIPGFAPVGGSLRVRFTGSIHDENGLLTGERRKIGAKLAHLRDKLLCQGDSLEIVDQDLDSTATTLIVAYGVPTGAARQAVKELRAEGAAVSLLTVYSLWPLPERAIRIATAPPVDRVLVPELNIGLYADELRRVIRDPRVESLTRIDGSLIAPDTIKRSFRECSSRREPDQEACPCPS